MGFFSESTCLLEFTQYHVVVISLLVYSLRRLVGRILICLNVTARSGSEFICDALM